MAARVFTTIFKLYIFTEILIVCIGQNTHMQNFALNKTCGTSSRYIRNGNEITGNCSAVINGNTNTYMDYDLPNCIHTAHSDTSPFWWVDLGEKFIINMITIYGRVGYIERMICVNVSLDGDVVKRFTDTSGWTNDKYDIPVGRSGRVVNITRDCTNNKGPTINICEVQVWVCVDGWYGDICTEACGQCDSACDKLNGSCMSCKTGFQMPQCKECADDWYGINCTQTCGNCLGSNCDKVNGSCGKCKEGFKPPLCKECVAGYYGKNCNHTCGHCLNKTICDPTNGTCPLGCLDGFRGDLCLGNLGGITTDKSTSDKDKETVSLAGPVAGAAVGCSVAFFIIGLVTGLWLRRFRTQQPSSSLCPPDETSKTRELGTSIAIPHPEETPDISSPGNTSDYNNINVYDALKNRDDNNTSSYTSLSFLPTQ